MALDFSRFGFFAEVKRDFRILTAKAGEYEGNFRVDFVIPAKAGIQWFNKPFPHSGNGNFNALLWQREPVKPEFIQHPDSAFPGFLGLRSRHGSTTYIPVGGPSPE